MYPILLSLILSNDNYFIGRQLALLRKIQVLFTLSPTPLPSRERGFGSGCRCTGELVSEVLAK
ncbi:MAG: hypothetical protein ABW098_18185 [Candidatus Thiodiazotropha sp.]